MGPTQQHPNSRRRELYVRANAAADRRDPSEAKCGFGVSGPSCAGGDCRSCHPWIVRRQVARSRASHGADRAADAACASSPTASGFGFAAGFYAGGDEAGASDVCAPGGACASDTSAPSADGGGGGAKHNGFAEHRRWSHGRNSWRRAGWRPRWYCRRYAWRTACSFGFPAACGHTGPRCAVSNSGWRPGASREIDARGRAGLPSSGP